MKKKISKEERKKQRKEKLEQFKMVFSKVTANEKKEKQADGVPRSFKIRRAGMVVGWAVFLSFGISSCTGDNEQAPKAVQVKEKAPVVIKENEAMSQAATQFAKDFADKYFFWTTSDKKEEYRQKDMSLFLAEGLDPYAGLNMDEVKTESHLIEAKVKDMEKVDKNKARITLLVKYEVSPGKAEDEKSSAKPEKKVITKGFVVPVEYNGSTYGVYELPTFTQLQDKTNVKIKNDITMQRASNSSDVQNITNFLNTFFSSYAQDSKDKLSYIVTDKKHLNGLGNSFKFVEVEESEVYEGKKKDEFIVICKAVFQDPDSQSKFTTQYNLTVVKKDGQFIVSKIN